MASAEQLTSSSPSSSRRDPSTKPPSPSRNTLSPTPTPGIRRALTVDESAQLRRRPQQNRFSTGAFESPSVSSSSPNASRSSNPGVRPLDDPIGPGIRRRSSTFSDLSFAEAQDLLLPRAASATNGDGQRVGEGETSGWHSAPLAFALLPALGGMFFQNGGAVVTDVMLLGLAAIFLNWSVRVPWEWYHSARSLRIADSDITPPSDAIFSDSDPEPDELSPPTPVPLSSVPEDTDPSQPAPSPTAPAPSLTTMPRRRIRSPSFPAESASSELHTHELLALLFCFLCPLLGAYLLHSIRSSLSRPSEGLVSNYNLTIFLLASELRPLSHLVKLIQARTLYLQRVLAANPYTPSSQNGGSGQGVGSGNGSGADIAALMKRVEELEASTTKSSYENIFSAAEASTKSAAASSVAVNTTAVTAEVRRTLQPELDALNRAVRRYEKRATLQTMQTEARLRELEGRVGDAVSLAAAASRQKPGFGMGVGEGVWKLVELPFKIFGALVSLPFVIAGVGLEGLKGAIFGRGIRMAGRERESELERDRDAVGRKGAGKSGKAAGYRMGGERVKVQGLKSSWNDL